MNGKPGSAVTPNRLLQPTQQSPTLEMTVTLPPNSTAPAPKLQPTGWLRYLSFSVDHKVIGLQYLVCGFVFYLIGGALAGAIRT